MRKKSSQIVLSTVLAIIFLLFWLWLIDLDQLVLFLGRVNFVFVGLVLLLIIFNTFVASYRLKILMKPIGEASVFYFWGINLVGGVVSLLMPFQGGGFLRAYLIKKKLHSNFSSCFAIVLFDFLFSVGMLFLFSLLAVVFFVSEKVVLTPSFWLMGVFLVICFWLALKTQKFGSWVEKFLRRLPLTKPIKERLVKGWGHFKRGLSLLSKDYWLLFSALIMTVFLFFLPGLAVCLLFNAFDQRVSLLPVLFARAIFGLSSFLPGTPLRIGQSELIGLAIYTFFLGLDKNLVAAVILLSRLLNISFALLGGFIASIVLGIKLSKVRETSL